MKNSLHLILAFALGVPFLALSCAHTRAAAASKSNATASGASGSGLVDSVATGNGAASASAASDASGTAAERVPQAQNAKDSGQKQDEPRRIVQKPAVIKVELPPSSGSNPFSGSCYTAKGMRLEFADEKKLRVYSYNTKDECWERELAASYSFNVAKAKLYVRTDCVYEDGDKLDSAKELYNKLWPRVKRSCKKYLSTSHFNSASKKAFMNYAMQNLENSSRARFERLTTFSYRLLDGGKRLELTTLLESELSQAARGQIIGTDKTGRIQIAFTNLTVQILALDDSAASSSFYIGNCEFDEDARKVYAQMFRIIQSEGRDRTVYESMQEAGIFEAAYSVKTQVNNVALKQRYNVYDALYKFTVASMPEVVDGEGRVEGLPALEQIEIPVRLHVDKYILKKEDNSAPEK